MTCTADYRGGPCNGAVDICDKPGLLNYATSLRWVVSWVVLRTVRRSVSPMRLGWPRRPESNRVTYTSGLGPVSRD